MRSVVPVHRKVIVCMLADAMKALAALSNWIDVHCHAARMGEMVKKLMAHLFGDRVPLGYGELARYADAHVGIQAMADPTRPHISDLDDPGHMSRRMRDSVHGLCLDSVQHSDDDHPR